jgi:predicted dehydrogenase
MNSVAIIGCGQLGSRHLQGMSTSKQPHRIYIVDPSEAALAVAVQRWNAMPNPNGSEVVACQDFSTLPPHLDFVVIASGADVRFDLLAKLLAGHQVRYLLLEKVLFQRLEHYAAAAQLLAVTGTAAYVNCARREFDVYRDIKELLRDDTLVELEVFGGAWGLGCNAVHFLDLFDHLTGELPEIVDVGGLVPGTIPSKRPGFVEFTGTVTGTSASGKRAILHAFENVESAPLITLKTTRSTIVVDESGGSFLHRLSAGQWNSVGFKLPFQSEATGRLADKLFETGTCDLPSFTRSAAIHEPLLNAFLSHLGQVDQQKHTLCPIT